MHTPDPMGADRFRLERVSTVEALSRSLRQRILEGTLSPGERLREVDVSNHYSVGRYTVRSAFQDLVYRGIAEHTPNRGVSVLLPTPAVVVDLYTYRAALECESVRVLITRGRDLSGPRTALEAFRRLSDDASWAQLLEADLDFHQSVVDGAGSEQMSGAFTTLRDRVMLCLAQLNAGRVGLVQDHEQLLEALATKGVTAAAGAFRTHLYDVALQLGADRRLLRL